MEKHICAPENAQKFMAWLQTRGGLAIWRSVNLSNPGASWTSPVNAPDGTPVKKPCWEAEETPSRIITDPAEVEVVVEKEVKRFHVAVRRGANGFMLKCTDASSKKIRRAEEKAGPLAWHRFDYETQEAVIFVPDRTVPLLEYYREVVAA